jgi:hypothetical protein
LEFDLRAGSGNGCKLRFNERAPSASDAEVLDIDHWIHTRAEICLGLRISILDALRIEFWTSVVQRIESWISGPVNGPAFEMSMCSGETRPGNG